MNVGRIRSHIVTESSTEPEDAMDNHLSDGLRQDLMLGLIYPAVLGSIFYTILGELGHQIRSIFGGDAYDVSFAVTLKFALAWIALGFYFCDYLYIAFTNQYRKKFFRYNLLFVGTMYGAFASVGLGEAGSPPAAKLVLFLYFVFMAFYFDWDRSELKQAKVKEEVDFYKSILRWEKYSMLWIGACFLTVLFLEKIWPKKDHLLVWMPSFLVVVAMGAVTWRFALHTRDKKKFSARYPVEGVAKGAPNPRPQADG
jgi:hypothetical protein